MVVVKFVITDAGIPYGCRGAGRGAVVSAQALFVLIVRRAAWSG